MQMRLLLDVQAEGVAAWPGLPAGLQMEVGSPFAWLCQAPQRLVVPQRMPGAPRIWTLPKAKLDPLARGLKVTTLCTMSLVHKASWHAGHSCPASALTTGQQLK